MKSKQVALYRPNYGTVLAVIVAFFFGAAIVFSLEVGFKWFFVAFMLISALCVAAVFPDFRLFVLLFLTASIPIAIQYDLIDHDNKFDLLNHHGGGAREAWVINLVDFPFALLILIWLYDLAAENLAALEWTRLDTYVVLFGGVSAVSIYASSQAGLLGFELMRYAKYYLLFWILRSYFSNGDYVRYCLYVLVLVSGLQFLVACLQYFLFFTLPFTLGEVSGSEFEVVNNVLIQRVSGLVGHCNTFAAYLIFPIVFSFMIFLFDRSLIIKWLSFVFFFVSGIALVLTFSRNIWLASALAFLLMGFVGIKKGKISTRFIVSICGVLLFGLIVLAFSGVLEVVFVRVFEDSGRAYDSRWDLIRVAIEMIQANPLTGIGLNSFEETMSYYDEVGVTNVIQQPVHNMMLLMLAETGPISLVVFLLMCRTIVNQILNLIHRSNKATIQEMDFILGVSAGIALFALFISNLMDISLRKEPIIGMCVLVIAMVYARSMNFARDEHEASSV